MKTTVDIPKKTLQEAMRHSGAATEGQAVVAAIEEYNRRHRRTRLAAELGTFEGFLKRSELEALRAEG